MNNQILEKINENTSLIDTLFGKKNTDNFYSYFYNAFLTTANSLPLNSLWIAFIDNIPIEYINSVLDKFENFQNSKNINQTRIVANLESKRIKSGLIIAQSVKIIGESFDVKRGKFSNKPGFVSGLIGDGRGDFQNLKIDFLETNVSFVDYVLRPWLIAVSHKSLKDPKLKTNITIWHLSKMGPRKNLKKRKVTVYKNCVPISIDEQEYNYTSGDPVLKRSVEFAFDYYYMDELDKTLLNLISTNYGKKSFYENNYKELKQELQKAFNPKNKTFYDYIDHIKSTPTTYYIDESGNFVNIFKNYFDKLINKAKAFGIDLVKGTLKRIVTNTKGAISYKINKSVQNLQGRLRRTINNKISSLNNKMNKMMGIGKNKSSISKNVKNNFKEIIVNKKDTPKFPKRKSKKIDVKISKINTNIKPNKDDTPTFNTPLKYKNVVINKDDYVSVNTKLLYENKIPDKDDHVKLITKLPYENKIPNKDDYVELTTKLPYENKIPNKDDYVKSTTKLSYENKIPNKDDYVKSTTKLPYENKIPDKNDVPNSLNIPVIIKNV